MSPSGGRRENSGRPPLDKNQDTVRRMVRLTEAQDAKVKRIGAGNFSAGMRLLIDRAQEDN